MDLRNSRVAESLKDFAIGQVILWAGDEGIFVATVKSIESDRVLVHDNNEEEYSAFDSECKEGYWYILKEAPEQVYTPVTLNEKAFKQLNRLFEMLDAEESVYTRGDWEVAVGALRHFVDWEN